MTEQAFRLPPRSVAGNVGMDSTSPVKIFAVVVDRLRLRRPTEIDAFHQLKCLELKVSLHNPACRKLDTAIALRIHFSVAPLSDMQFQQGSNS